MRDREDRDAWLARRRAEECADVERLALQPAGEPGRSDETVDPQREVLAILRRIELLDVERTDPSHRRLLDLIHEGLKVEVLPRGPGGGEECREEDVLAALHRIRRDSDEREEARRGRRNAFAEELGVLAQCRGRGGEGANDG